MCHDIMHLNNSRTISNKAKTCEFVFYDPLSHIFCNKRGLPTTHFPKKWTKQAGILAVIRGPE